MTAPESSSPRILVVDDNEMNCDLLVRRLNRQSMQAISVNGGTPALAHIAAEKFDLVLLDINMPDLDGISVLETIRETHSMAELPVIMVSAQNESHKIAEVINKGANDYITKPIDFNVAFARINTHLDLAKTHAQLKESQERYELAFRGANDGLWDWDLRSGQMYFSDRWKNILGLENVSFAHDPEKWFEQVHPDDISDLKQAIEEHLLGQTKALRHEYRALHMDGQFRWLLTRGVASRGTDGQAIRISGSLTDITERTAYDPITSIPNKVLFMDRLEWLMARERRQTHGRFSVLLIKIDRLNELRQSLGPVVGENILVEMAQRLVQTLRAEGFLEALNSIDSITISRHDDADFAILLESCRDEVCALKIAAMIQELIHERLNIPDEEIHLTGSIGIVSSTPTMKADTSADNIIAHALAALERSKSKGYGHTEIFDDDMQGRALNQLKMETNLRRSVAAGELTLHYQPIVHIHNGELFGCEALCRWTHPDHGVVPPDVFIPLAEKCGLIDAIGEWVLHEACTQHRAWCDAGFEPIDMSVNLSVLQLHREDIEHHILDILKNTQMDPKRLKLEITESIFMEDIERINTILTNLNDLGIGIAIDDFGTGFSSLSYLNRLPITHLKIDRSFISEVSNDVAAQAIVQSTLLMAQSLGIAVIAEGIEELDQVALLKILKAEFGQGYHYGKPIIATDFAKLLTPKVA